ncbi:MAG TPA: GNAT family N-acetyltransferase [Candidatus Lokiarchaeia archaeon]|nr:GNAT family N-acetyltransferase [Candidatus Lokiarchaeia archaeon]
MKIQFRKASENDVQVLGQMNKRLIEDEGHSNPMNVDELTERMKGFLNNEYTAYLIIANGTLSGYCLFRDDWDYVYVRHLFVERTSRHTGLGSTCIRWLKNNLWANRKVRIEVLCHNDSGIAFWRKIGFRDYSITMEMQ